MHFNKGLENLTRKLQYTKSNDNNDLLPPKMLEEQAQQKERDEGKGGIIINKAVDITGHKLGSEIRSGKNKNTDVDNGNRILV